jgi:protein-disulfide isomerase
MTSKRYYRRALLAAAALLAIGAPTLAGAQSPQLITAAAQQRILADPGTAALGSPGADVTIVEYFDYNCPYCKSLAPILRTFMAMDHGAKIVYKDWPILGAVSIYAARSALAAQWQGKYLQAHDALMSSPRLAENAQVDAALQRAGIDVTKLKQDMAGHSAAIDALLTRNDAEAHSLGMRGTPGVLVQRQVASGISEVKDLQAAAADARHQR